MRGARVWGVVAVCAALVACSPPAPPAMVPVTVTPTPVACRTLPPPPATPRSVIVMIGDGMGFSQLDLATLWQDGTTFGQVATTDGTPEAVPGEATLALERLDVELAMSTFPVPDGTAPDGYDAALAWSDPGWVTAGATDSAASATALATGTKTTNGSVGTDPDGEPLETLAERAVATGRAAGLVTSVPFSHATPASFGAHEADRHALDRIAHDLIGSDLSVVIGAGHPFYDDSHRRRDRPDYAWVSRADWADLTGGQTGFVFLDGTDELTALAEDPDPPARVFGVAQVGSTLQADRAGPGGPGAAPRNDVPDLATLSRAALSVLDSDPDGFFLMVEGGAIDWASHDHSTGRTIEEVLEFDAAVAAVVDWVTARDAWDSTLLVVTADHETGRPGAPDGPWSPLTGERGELPEVTWRADGHVNTLVPFAAKGAGAAALAALADQVDPVRGRYLDSTELAGLVLGRLWPVPA